MPGLKIYLTPLARLDLEVIWAYTFYTLSEKQVNKYLSELDAGFKEIASDYQSGKSVDRIKSGYWRYKINHHFVFYMIESDSLKIIRVLHEKMNIVKHLH